MINVFVIDDHLYLSKGIAEVLKEKNYGIKVVGYSTSARQALQRIEHLDVDVVILDIVMPEMDGIITCRLLKKQFPEIKVIAFTGELDSNKLLRMWQEDADGILNKVCGPEALVKAIKRVLIGMRIIGKEIPTFLVDIESDTGNTPNLTKTEFEVLKLLGTGIKRKDIADEMNRSMYSIDFHIRNMYKKFKTNRLHLLLIQARKQGLIKASK